jgi:hypothetical protein
MDAIVPALLAAQAQIGPVPKGAKNPHFQSRYADLSDVLEAVRGPLAAHEILVLNPVRPEGDGRLEIACVLMHASGQWVRSRIVLPANVLKPQEIGSALTYYRRYLLAALLSVATEDDDGTAASRPAPATPAGVTPRGSGSHDVRTTVVADVPPRETWAAWSARECTRINDAWRAAMAMENISTEGRKDFRELVNVHQLVNKITTHAIEKGLLHEASVQRTGADGTPVRDRSLAQAAVADLYVRRPNGIRKFVERYVREKEHEARVALGMPLIDGDETPAVGTADNGTVPVRAPGEDG